MIKIFLGTALCLALLSVSSLYAQKSKAKASAKGATAAKDTISVGLKLAEGLGILSSVEGAEQALQDSMSRRVTDVPKGYWQTAVKALNIRSMFGAQIYNLFSAQYTPKEIEQVLGYLSSRAFPESDEVAKRFINGQTATNKAINERFVRISEYASMRLYADYHGMRAKSSPILTTKIDPAVVKALTPFLEEQGDIKYADTLHSDVQKMIDASLKDAPANLFVQATQGVPLRQILINAFTAAYAKHFTKAEISALGKMAATNDSKGAESLIEKFNSAMAAQLGIDISTALNQVNNYLNDLVLQHYYQYKLQQLK